MANQVQAIKQEPSFKQERIELAAAFRWAARMELHEAVANHFSLAANDDGTQFLMNPNQMHFSRIRASDLLLIDANDVATMDKPCLLYTSPSPRDLSTSRMPSSA